MAEDNSIQPDPQTSGNNTPKNDFTRKSAVFVWEFLKIAFVAAIIVLPIRYFLFQPFIVKGDSMIPNYQDGNYLIVDEISYRFTTPKRGDVIVLKYPLDPSQRFIKRVVGLPGETVDIKNGKVDIIKDGKDMFLSETYLPATLQTDGTVHTTLKDGQYFVMGDNREYSYDSRRWGILPKEDIIGRAAIRIFPIWKATYLTTPKY